VLLRLDPLPACGLLTEVKELANLVSEFGNLPVFLA
jgi:hypothetical protein